MLSVKIIGAGGYGGVGLIELLGKHPRAEVSCLVDITNLGKKISDLYPHLKSFCDLKIVAPDSPEAEGKFDCVFFSTPDGIGMQTVGKELEKGSKVIDFSGDFRFGSSSDYSVYANFLGRDPKHKSSELLSETVYGLPELYRDKIDTQKRLIGNPGCMAISSILGLAPAAREGIIDPKSIICDCKTGVSGGGMKPAPAFHYPARYEQMNSYKLTGHQHLCEIKRELGALSNGAVGVTMTTQIMPVCRGIMSTLYATLVSDFKCEEVVDLYRDFYSNDEFVRVFDRQTSVGTQQVRGTNYCDLLVDVDCDNQRLRVVSHIDNLVKGQAGNAVQNMNLLFGFDEKTGLDTPPSFP